MSRANIRDVARHAGVSIATVSYIVNNKPCNVSQETRERVMRVVEELDYVPNSLARSIFTKTTNVIGFAFNYTAEEVILDPYLSLIFLGVSKAAQVHSMDLLLHTSLPTFEEIESMSAFLDNRIDGLLVLNPRRNDKLLSYLSGKGLPTVAIGVTNVPDGIGYATVDDMEGARLAVNHLIELGHRRIAHIRGPQASDSAMNRELGYRRALEEAGIPFDPELMVPGSYIESGCIAAAQVILNMKSLPTAIFISNDRGAFAVIDEFAKHGISVPDDISIVSFDDVPLSGRPHEYLTTVHHPIRDIANASVDSLIRMLAGAPVSECRVIIPPKLIIRNTTLPLKS